MSNRHYNEHDIDTTPIVLPPPEPPKLMRLHVYESDELTATFRDVTGSSLAAPSVFRFETLDGRIRLFDMTGRDFVLTPQES